MTSTPPLVYGGHRPGNHGPIGSERVRLMQGSPVPIMEPPCLLGKPSPQEPQAQPESMLLPAVLWEVSEGAGETVCLSDHLRTGI